MTIHEISNQLIDLSVGGYINGEKFSKVRLENQLRRLFRDEEHLAIAHTVVMEIALPDGRWFFSIDHHNDKPDGFDYWIPDNREQEADLFDRLINRGA